MKQSSSGFNIVCCVKTVMAACPVGVGDPGLCELLATARPSGHYGF